MCRLCSKHTKRRRLTLDDAQTGQSIEGIAPCGARMVVPPPDQAGAEGGVHGLLVRFPDCSGLAIAEFPSRSAVSATRCGDRAFAKKMRLIDIVGPPRQADRRLLPLLGQDPGQLVLVRPKLLDQLGRRRRRHLRPILLEPHLDFGCSCPSQDVAGAHSGMPFGRDLTTLSSPVSGTSGTSPICPSSPAPSSRTSFPFAGVPGAEWEHRSRTAP